jgi:outer membrane protein assembly factor BamB
MIQSFVAAALLCAALAAPASAQAPSLDWPQWRGPNRDGTVGSFAAPKTWPANLALRWKVNVGIGYATPLVVGDRVYTFSRIDENEVLMALDAATGKQLWQTAYPVPIPKAGGIQHGPGPKSTPLFHNGKLYSLGVKGAVSAFNAADGKLLWQKPGSPVEPQYEQTATSPLADGNVVIVHVGGHDDGALTAFDATTGAVKWTWTGDGPAYASPIFGTFGGVRQVVSVTQKNVVGVSPTTGELLWQRPFANAHSNHSNTPILHGDIVIVTGQEKGVTAFRPERRDNQWITTDVWHTQEVSMYLSNPVLVGDTLYGLSHMNGGQYFALDVTTGKTRWLGRRREGGTHGHRAAFAWAKAGDLLFVLNNDAELLVARGGAAGLEPIARYKVAETETWAQPVLSGDRVFVKDLSTLALWTLN